MSLLGGMECVVCLGCSRWAWKRCTYIGSYDSENWAAVAAEEFQAVPHVCRLILAVYEEDLRNPRYPPTPGGYRLNPDWVVKRMSYENTGGKSPPYLIYADRDASQVVLAIRGLNLGKESDYRLLLNNKLGMQMFDGGYAHHGLLKSAVWLLERESETIKGLVEEMGPDCKVVFAGHSLGSGIAALMTIVAVNHRDRVGGVPRSQITGYAVAPARCMSLNLAVKYADVIHSIVLQDDFLPRTPTPLEDIFRSLFCLPCLLFVVCMRDTFIPEGRKLKDPRRLYAPGRMYHIVERKLCRCGRFPPVVRTAIPVEGRFEHIVLSSNATNDHAIIWIERESEKALKRMKETMKPLNPPEEQKMERMESHKMDHKNALEKALSLNVPYSETLASAPSESSLDGNELENQEEGRALEQVKSSGKTKWNDLVEMLFERDEAGALVFRNVDIEGK